MLTISGIHEGYVLDHIKAGMAQKVYKDMKLDELHCTIAMIMNVHSNKLGKKDMLKIECPIGSINLDVLGFIDHNITVDIIKDEKIIEKRPLHMPKLITNVISCKNPRCITTTEQELDQVFFLADEENEVYRCKYCEEKYSR
ncbi:MAG: aspartate carbamoyltransferase regulatory subunit [Lachnospiraceae bacterium]|nr:aspartate carbamoyltransferase regulatory subunit [Lachnospiraceae bacterium]